MILPDVNVLIYAFRGDLPQHAVCKPWLERVVAADAHFGISPLVLSSVVRITTNSRVFKEPSSIGDAFSFCNALLGKRNCEVVTPGERHWSIFERLCFSGVRGSRVADAWLAALALEHDCTWITYDRDFARFTGLTWQEPTM